MRPIVGLIACLFYGTLVSTNPVATSEAKWKRDNAAVDLVNSLASNLASGITAVSEVGNDLLNELLGSLPGGGYTIPQHSNDRLVRSLAIDSVQAAFDYGPPLAGGPSYPSGLLGIAKVAIDVANIQVDLTSEIALGVLDVASSVVDITKYDGLQTVEDYTKLYNDEWTNVLPNGPDLGVETNYTEDLLFSMQRLSASPYQVRRLNPASDVLPFQISDTVATNISGMTLGVLFEQGRLFYADYRDQKNLTSSGKYAAACDAYFFIDATSQDFLPLAIRTNVGASLIYTPADSSNDWLLAKMMYNVNDFWFAQWNHLAATHEVVQIVWMAAIRTISQQHPIYAILNRLTYEVFSIQVLAQTVLFMPGAAVDLVFPWTGQSAQSYTTNRYKNSGAGRFQANYLNTDLITRGLIDSAYGPPLKSFPFYEDATVVQNAIKAFITSFVRSYYVSDSVVAADTEIQAWAAECNGAAEAIDFPSKIASIDDLINILTHMAHLVSTSHHAVNTNELLQVSSTLPFCPPALYHDMPTEKGITDAELVKFLPPFTQVQLQFTVGALFARPLLAGTNRTIIHMFDDQTMLKLMNSETQAANTVFMSSMKEFSAQVSERSFDADGLSQGMPFIWKALDPNVAPYSIAT